MLRLFHDLPIRRKVITAILAASTLAFALVAIAVAVYEATTFRPHAVRDLRAQAEILASTLAPSLIFADPATATNMLNTLHAVPHIAVAAIYGADGIQFAQYTTSGQPAPERALEPLGAKYVFTTGSLRLEEPIIHAGETLGYLYVEQTLKPIYSRLPQYTIMVVAVAGALIIVGLLLSFSLDRTISAPIRTLSQLAREVTRQQDYAVRTAVRGQDEVGALANALNDMLATIQHEISAHTQAEAALRASESRLTQFMDGLPIGVWVVDHLGRPIFANRHATMLLGRGPRANISLAELVRHYRVYITGTRELYPHDNMPIVRALAGEASVVDDMEIHREDRAIPIEVTATPIYGPDHEVQFAIAAFSDITVRLRAQQRVVYLAHHDSLTGLANRRGFHERLEQALAVAKRHQGHVALLFIDLDRFKAINDTLGHQTADALLIAMGARLQDAVREMDTVARLGGDEFAIVIAEIDSADAATAIARKIRAALAEPYNLYGRELVATASVGVSVFPRDADTPDALVSCADTAMYAVKQSGRNDFAVYSSAMDVDAAGRLDLIHGLRRALERHEFTLHYQPQVDAKTGYMIGAEALIRWRHPNRGLIYPSEFIPIAEEFGLIGEIGAWTVRETCRQVHAWQEAGLSPIRVAINLSPVQFRNPSLIRNLAAMMREAHVDPTLIELEITENVFMGAADTAGVALRSLKNLGVTLAIDDFGTGFSSLGYLRRFPIDKLKIDQSFVRDIVTDPSNAAIASAIVALSKELQLRVIAEGVETQEQAQFLASKGCEQFQGYLFGRPVAADSFGQLLRAQDRVAYA